MGSGEIYGRHERSDWGGLPGKEGSKSSLLLSEETGLNVMSLQGQLGYIGRGGRNLESKVKISSFLGTQYYLRSRNVSYLKGRGRNYD